MITHEIPEDAERIELEDGRASYILSPEDQAKMVGDVRERSVRMSTLDGFTIHRRNARRPRVHLLRPYPRCLQNVPPENLEQIVGSRELAIEAIGNGGVPCERCFPKEESNGD